MSNETTMRITVKTTLEMPIDSWELILATYAETVSWQRTVWAVQNLGYTPAEARAIANAIVTQYFNFEED